MFEVAFAFQLMQSLFQIFLRLFVGCIECGPIYGFEAVVLENNMLYITRYVRVIYLSSFF